MTTENQQQLKIYHFKSQRYQMATIELSDLA